MEEPIRKRVKTIILPYLFSSRNLEKLLDIFPNVVKIEVYETRSQDLTGLNPNMQFNGIESIVFRHCTDGAVKTPDTNRNILQVAFPYLKSVELNSNDPPTSFVVYNNPLFYIKDLLLQRLV